MFLLYLGEDHYDQTLQTGFRLAHKDTISRPHTQTQYDVDSDITCDIVPLFMIISKHKSLYWVYVSCFCLYLCAG